MKIKCGYCGNYFEDYMDACPNCSAPNDGLKRTANDTPRTIEELEAWYKSKGLPDYETTRFFIGIDYKKPRAFGIYRDTATGNVVVYKNKDNGDRAVRYEGTDEAYGVNELYQRLKQEIIEQKMNNVKKAKGGTTSSSGSNSKKSGSLFGGLLSILLVIAGIFGAIFLLIMLIGTIIIAVSPKEGYYNYNNTYYYYDDSGYADRYVYEYDPSSSDWKYPVTKDENPGIFAKKSKCKSYFLSEKWDNSYACTDINNSYTYRDYEVMGDTTPGYYKTDDGYYYHHGYDYDSDWYYYDDDDWTSIDSDALPVDLSHASEVGDFYYTSSWDSSTQFSDFTDSDEYEENYASQYSSDSDSDSDYSWDSSDSWDSGSSDWDSDW